MGTRRSGRCAQTTEPRFTWVHGVNSANSATVYALAITATSRTTSVKRPVVAASVPSQTGVVYVPSGHAAHEHRAISIAIHRMAGHVALRTHPVIDADQLRKVVPLLFGVPFRRRRHPPEMMEQPAALFHEV